MLDSDDEERYAKRLADHPSSPGNFLLGDTTTDTVPNTVTVDQSATSMAQRQRSIQRHASAVTRNVYRQNTSLSMLSPQSPLQTALPGALMDIPGTASRHSQSLSRVDNDEQEFERPDWAEHFSSTPLSIMEEAARKSMARGAVQSPSWESWRNDLRKEGQEMASQWGSRDKSTRTIPPAFVEEPDDYRPEKKSSSAAGNKWEQE